MFTIINFNVYIFIDLINNLSVVFTYLIINCCVDVVDSSTNFTFQLFDCFFITLMSFLLSPISLRFSIAMVLLKVIFLVFSLTCLDKSAIDLLLLLTLTVKLLIALLLASTLTSTLLIFACNSFLTLAIF